MDLYQTVSLLLLVCFTDAGSHIKTPDTVLVPYVHATDYMVWENIEATYQKARNCTKVSCNYIITPDCRTVVTSCPVVIQYDRCEITNNPHNVFYEDALAIKKKPCTSRDCSQTCPGSNCISPGTTVKVGIRCWRSDDVEAGNVTATFNVTSVLESPFENCPMLTVPYGILSTADNSHCNHVTISCIHGYKLIGESVVTCCNGTWSAVSPSCRKGCTSFSVANGFISTRETQSGPVATVICNDGYSLTESPTVSCIDDAWDKAAPKCYAGCSALQIQNGKMAQTRIPHSEETEVTCDSGFSLSGMSKLTCFDGGWTEDIPKCNKDCHRLNIQNGKLSSNTISHGSVVDVTCSDGYIISRVKTLVCTEGAWNEHPPVCHRECGNNTYGENCTSSCDCVTSNTENPEQSCDSFSGKCRCLRTWEGDNCNVDVDECLRGSHDCDVTRYMCRNNPGGFICVARTVLVYDQGDESLDFILPLGLGLGIMFILVASLASYLFWQRAKRKRIDTSQDGEISYVDLDILQDKDIRSRNYSHNSDDSGYFERNGKNPLNTNLEESVPSARTNTPEPGKEVDWENEDLTYL